MTTPRLPSAEEILNDDHWFYLSDKQRIERLRAYGNDLLEAAAETVKHLRCAQLIRKLKEDL